MKKSVPLILIIACFLCSCTFLDIGSSNNEIEKPAKLLTEANSTVEFNIYPEKIQLADVFERYQYQTLSDVQKSAYIAMDNGIYSMAEGYIDVGKCDYRDLEIAYYALRSDRPEYFWLPTTYTLSFSDAQTKIKFSDENGGYLFSAEERKQAEQEIKKMLQSFLTEIDGVDGKTQYEYELYAHDWLANTSTYDETSDDKKTAWSIYGALVNGKAVCEGYARSLQLLLYMAGIENTLATGITTDAHMWNVVKINNEWFHVDVTANDSGNLGYHSYFNVTDNAVLQTRTIDREFVELSDDEIQIGSYNNRLPKCSSLTYNYHIINGTYIATMANAEQTIIGGVIGAALDDKDRVEFTIGDNIGYNFDRETIKQFCDVQSCLTKANDELMDDDKIYVYYICGIKGSKSFMIYWD